jgi:hypothetical protein
MSNVNVFCMRLDLAALPGHPSCILTPVPLAGLTERSLYNVYHVIVSKFVFQSTYSKPKMIANRISSRAGRTPPRPRGAPSDTNDRNKHDNGVAK